MRSPCTATKSRPSSPQLEKAREQQQRPNAAKINKFFKKTKKLSRAGTWGLRQPCAWLRFQKDAGVGAGEGWGGPEEPQASGRGGWHG